MHGNKLTITQVLLYLISEMQKIGIKMLKNTVIKSEL